MQSLSVLLGVALRCVPMGCAWSNMDVGVYSASILHRLDGGELQLRSRL